MAETSLHSRVDGYGFVRAKDFDYKTYEEVMSGYLSIMARRAIKWSRLIGDKDTVAKSRTLKRYCRKGIPQANRTMVWMSITGAERRWNENPHLYTQMVSAMHSQDLVDTIKMDVHRTFPENLYFSTSGDTNNLHLSLYNVLLALGHKNEGVGYCQGMNFVAAMLLLVIKNEERAFWLMDSLINEILPNYYSPTMKEVKLEQEVLGELIKLRCPEVHAHMERHGMAWCLVGMKWFICLFSDVLPVDTTLRVWDALFFEGEKVLIRASMWLIISHKEKILACKSFTEMTDLFKSMLHDRSVLNCQGFLNNIFKNVGSLPRSLINKLRKECESRV